MPAGEIASQTLAKLRKIAERHSRVGHEADDLVQDILLAAIELGRDLTEPSFLPWASGAIRNRAAFVARTAARRRKREMANGISDSQAAPSPKVPEEVLSALPPSRRVVALLINLGMERAEIGYLLGLSDVALRQRLSGLRKALSGCNEIDALSPTSEHRADGLARRVLKSSLPATAQRTFAIRDPDGNPIFFSRRDHISGPSSN